MMLIAALYNHKGGVSKTTTTFNFAHYLASEGKRVLLVDADAHHQRRTPPSPIITNRLEM